MKSSLNREYLWSKKSYLLEGFAALPNHINYLHPNIKNMIISLILGYPYFYHDQSCIIVFQLAFAYREIE